MKAIFSNEIKTITTSDAITKKINRFRAVKESFFKESLKEEESILF